jgi:hypothetical protein
MSLSLQDRPDVMPGWVSADPAVGVISMRRNTLSKYGVGLCPTPTDATKASRVTPHARGAAT